MLMKEYFTYCFMHMIDYVSMIMEKITCWISENRTPNRQAGFVRIENAAFKRKADIKAM